MSNDAKKQPAYETPWYGHVTATVWANHGKNGPLYNTDLKEHFQDANDSDKWKSTHSISASELGNVTPAAQDAHKWIAERQQAEAKDRRQQRAAVNG